MKSLLLFRTAFYRDRLCTILGTLISILHYSDELLEIELHAFKALKSSAFFSVETSPVLMFILGSSKRLTALLFNIIYNNKVKP